mmetsp:Transcript_7123/g.12265  ORF Transcript_7123/g.12265 Transcript_7123/m.12265 type:complete len:828 (-) Transcript_7123:440-2923(-)
MRIQIKGGVWKNTEDEILKAAVMKYGLNQWSRISSLLVRKSAKQCKARWYEWLDPTIKKTEWTREEDEKLLHLAKLMPTQWRTIAPIVGRTPIQCLDRYEKLLDMAVSKEDKYDAADDPRRLRPGEIDPNPESKPARPDAIDMDEEEKEMLSEARARMANTRGKKAKRKARERQMEEARRLASMQKKRELKAAGIEMSMKDKKRRTIDYNAEVAFERKPAPGFYDVSEELSVTKELAQEFRPITLEELEGRRRKDVEEELVKRDIKRQKIGEAANAPGSVARDAELNDPVMIRRKGRMMLPAPQVSEQELEAIARMSTEALLDEAVAEGAGGDATRHLMGSYGPTPLRTASAATPARTAPSGDRIMMEAQNLSRLQNMNTPLLGGDNPDLHPSDFSGITPRSVVPPTPNPLLALATPGGRTPAGTPATTVSVRRNGTVIAGVSATPSATPGRGAVGATPGRTPIRDELGLNDSDSMAVHMGTPLQGGRRGDPRLSALRSELRQGLGALPAPQNEYQVVAPELQEDDAMEEDGVEEDAADAKARKLRDQAARAAAEEKKKSLALQRGLPRPLSADSLPAPRPLSELSKLSLRERAEDMLLEELTTRLRYDSLKFPSPPVGKEGKEAKKLMKLAEELAKNVPALEDYPQAELDSASAMLAAEVESVQAAMGHSNVSQQEYMEAFMQVHADLFWLPSKGGYARVASATASDRIESLKNDYDLSRSEMEREAKKASKLEQKVTVLITGLQQRHNKLRKQADELWDALSLARSEHEAFKALHEREQVAAPERIEALMDLVKAQQDKEVALQLRFKGLSRERLELAELLLSQS